MAWNIDIIHIYNITKKLNMNYILFPPRSGFVQQAAG